MAEFAALDGHVMRGDIRNSAESILDHPAIKL